MQVATFPIKRSTQQSSWQIELHGRSSANQHRVWTLGPRDRIQQPSTLFDHGSPCPAWIPNYQRASAVTFQWHADCQRKYEEVFGARSDRPTALRSSTLPLSHIQHSVHERRHLHEDRRSIFHVPDFVFVSEASESLHRWICTQFSNNCVHRPESSSVSVQLLIGVGVSVLHIRTNSAIGRNSKCFDTTLSTCADVRGCQAGQLQQEKSIQSQRADC